MSTAVGPESTVVCPPADGVVVPIAVEAGLGDDGLWHPIDAGDGAILCDHLATWRPRRVRLAEPVRTRPILGVPRPVRCCPHPTAGVPGHLDYPVGDPGFLWPGRADIPPVPTFDAWWRPDRPPDWWVWHVLYPVQGRRCAACRRRPPQTIDHDHATGLVRGLLCLTCNWFEPRCPHGGGCYADYLADPPAGRYGWQYRRR